MAATLSLDTLTSSGSGITVATGKTLTVGGVSVTAGSTNVQRATTDVTIGTTTDYEVSGKSEVVVAANAASSNRTITLPAVDAVGMDTCIITVVADADATSTYELKVQDADSNEVWTGYQAGDFVRLVVSNSAWLVVDHKETYFSHRWLTSTASIATSATTKLTGWTLVKEVGNAWDNSNDKLTTPTGMNGYWTVSFNSAVGSQMSGCTPTLYVNGSAVSQYGQGYGTSGYLSGQNGVTGTYYATSAQDVEFYSTNIRSDYAEDILGGGISSTHFTAQFERVY
jgi:hypothetical protein